VYLYWSSIGLLYLAQSDSTLKSFVEITAVELEFFVCLVHPHATVGLV